jgi:phosphoglycerate dehydrogenase-like enzyme
MHAAFVDAVRAGGGEPAPVESARAIIWADPARADAFPDLIARAPHVEWVQLPFAGIEPFASYLDRAYVWTCGKGVYARPVAEHALTLMLAGLRGLDLYARADRWREPIGRNVLGAAVTIVGGGGICDELCALLAPFGCDITIVRRTVEPRGDARVVSIDDVLPAVARADVVVLALALTDATRGLVDASFLAAMQPHSWLVNVARGAHVVTDDLVDALNAGRIGGAALDVTDPEPLPAGHALWRLPNVIVTPHIANTPEMGLPLITERVRRNVARFAAGEPLTNLDGLVDVSLGY